MINIDKQITKEIHDCVVSGDSHGFYVVLRKNFIKFLKAFEKVYGNDILVHQTFYNQDNVNHVSSKRICDVIYSNDEDDQYLLEQLNEMDSEQSEYGQDVVEACGSKKKKNNEMIVNIWKC